MSDNVIPASPVLLSMSVEERGCRAEFHMLRHAGKQRCSRCYTRGAHPFTLYHLLIVSNDNGFIRVSIPRLVVAVQREQASYGATRKVMNPLGYTSHWASIPINHDFRRAHSHHTSLAENHHHSFSPHSILLRPLLLLSASNRLLSLEQIQPSTLPPQR